MKSCILISSHLNNEYKISVAIDNIKRIKKFSDLPIVFVGNYVIPSEIQSLVSFCFYQSHNPVINRYMFDQFKTPNNVKLFDKDSLFLMKKHDYGYAHLEQIYNGMRLIKSLGFDHSIHFNYDINVDGNSFTKLKNLLSVNENIFFNLQNGDGLSTHSFCIITSKFIDLWEKNHMSYKNGTPTGLRKNFTCEEFFKWMLSVDNFINECVVSPSGIFKSSVDATSGNSLYMMNYGITPFNYKEKELIVISSKKPINELRFTVNGSSLTPKFLSKEINYYLYLLPYVKGDYYIENDLIFNSIKLLNRIKLPKK